MSIYRRKLMMAYAANKRSDDIIYPGLIAAWSAKGKTNDDADRAILKDLTGNGHDITLNNFAWNTESGYSNPKYPDALVFDGVDDYGVNKDMPILTDYTIICKRKYLNINKGSVLISKPNSNVYTGAFTLERLYLPTRKPSTFSFGNEASNIIEKLDTFPLITYQSKKNYNGINLYSGNQKDSERLYIGGLVFESRCANIAFYSAYLFDRSLDEQEIKSFIRKYIDPEYLLPSEIVPTPPQKMN